LGCQQVLQAIDKGINSGGGDGRHWVLDPVDGTFGFVKGDQYAIALALVERGEVRSFSSSVSFFLLASSVSASSRPQSSINPACHSFLCRNL